MEKSIISSRLRALRKEMGFTQQEIADTLGISVAAVQQYEYGTREPNCRALVAYERYFNVTGSYLLGYDEECMVRPNTVSGGDACDVDEPEPLEEDTRTDALLKYFSFLSDLEKDYIIGIMAGMIISGKDYEV